MASIRYDKVDKIYADGTKALHAFELDVDDGEFMVFVGPSGCGKSTALRMTAGLEDISRGRLLIGGQVVNDKSPQERNIAMVFQDYALYPHMTVRGNMGFALRMMGLAKNEINKRVEDAADRLSLRALLDRKPKNLSGGQRQRVAMGRALVREPKVFLLDEPLSNLDAKLRVQMRAEIAGLQKQLGVTSLYVTHDQVEAMTMGDRVAVLKDGRLQQCDAPQELYDHPQNTFVAAFIGSPRMNLFRSHLRRGNDGSVTLAVGEKEWHVPTASIREDSTLRRAHEGPVTVGLRPESLALDAEAPESLSLDVVAEVVEMLGNETLINFSGAVEPAVEDDGRDGMPGEGTSSFISGDHMPMVARLVPPVRLRENSEIRLRVNPDGIYLFDDEGNAVS